MTHPLRPSPRLLLPLTPPNPLKDARPGRCARLWAAQASCKLDLTYAAPGVVPAARRIRPLSLDFWGLGWALTAWCELRQNFRCFRLDRMEALAATGETFRPEPGRTLVDYMRRLAEEGYAPEASRASL